MNQFIEFITNESFQIGSFTINIQSILVFFLVLILAPLLLFFLQRFFIGPYFKKRNLEEGRVFAFSTLIKYIYYVIVVFIAFQIAGVAVSALWTSAAALLVGVGLGLQQTFNDFASGIILLMEGAVQKGDWIEIGNMEGRVDSIGLRTSTIRTRDHIVIIVPNSKITVDSVVNLSHNDNKLLRRNVRVGVAYGSDVKLVKAILLECADKHSLISKKIKPSVFFQDFGDSALVFDLFFWSKATQQLPEVRSDLRFLINEAFRRNKIEIPFPQRDLHIKAGSFFPEEKA